MIGWLDCAAGMSGDMLLGALVDAGAPLETIQQAVDAVGVEPLLLSAETVTRQGVGAVKVTVGAPRTSVSRTWPNIRAELERSALAEPVRQAALSVFERLARAEARVHRTEPEQVHFHEVGALDAVGDVVGCCAALAALGVSRLTASRVTLGSGVSRGEHGLVPVPAPAVLELLASTDAPTWGGPAPYEMCTPTGAALLAVHVRGWGPLPTMRVRTVGVGAGSRDLAELPNVVRLVLGEAAEQPPDRPGSEHQVVLETNVDDLDPRLWPGVLADLLHAGAADAWLSPILMKKGRPAHTLHVLCTESAVAGVRHAVFTQTSSIGVREVRVDKQALDREVSTVDIDGQEVRIKVARLDGSAINASIEYEDVVAAAAALGRPVKMVLAEATAAAHAQGLLP